MHGHGVRYQRNNRAGDHDPHHHRVEVNLEDRPACILVQALVYQVQIFFQGGAVGDHGGHLPAGLVEASFGIQRLNLLAAFEHVNNGPLAAVIWLVFLSVRAANQRVGADTHFVSIAHLLLFVPIEGGAGEPDHDDNDAKVNDVAPVTSSVAVRELEHRGKETLASVSFYDPAAANELRDYG